MTFGDVIITKPYPTSVRGRIIKEEYCDRVGIITGIHYAHTPVLYTVRLQPTGTEVALFEDELDGPYTKGKPIPHDEAIQLLNRIMDKEV